MTQQLHFWVFAEQTQTTNLKEYNAPPLFTETLFIVISVWKQSKGPSVDEWIKTLWNIYTMEF